MRGTRACRVRCAAIVAAALLSTGCGVYLPHALVLRANYNAGRGEYETALRDYQRAAELGGHDQALAYNRGNIDHLEGRYDLALQSWDTADRTSDRALQFRVAFNRAVYHFDQSDFANALQQFRRALTLEPGNVGARVGFEISLQRLEAEQELLLHDEVTSQTDSVLGLSESSTEVLSAAARSEDRRWRAQRAVPTDEQPFGW